MKKIYDKTVDCYCNINPDSCDKYCKCYCHVPIWFRNFIWWLQGTSNLKEQKK